jgi:hypothetical protein
VPDGPGENDSPESPTGRKPTQRIDPADYKERVDRMSELFSSMIDTATEQATMRCPYKNRHHQCTAEFGCRNQRKPQAEGSPLDCASDDKLDYRSAWEST